MGASCIKPSSHFIRRLKGPVGDRSGWRTCCACTWRSNALVCRTKASKTRSTTVNPFVPLSASIWVASRCRTRRPCYESELISTSLTFTHYAQEDLPFGGVGPSGRGAYHSIEGFRALSHAKGGRAREIEWCRFATCPLSKACQQYFGSSPPLIEPYAISYGRQR